MEGQLPPDPLRMRPELLLMYRWTNERSVGRSNGIIPADVKGHSRGHVAGPRGNSPHFERCEQLFKRLRIARLGNRFDVKPAKLVWIYLLIIAD